MTQVHLNLTAFTGSLIIINHPKHHFSSLKTSSISLKQKKGSKHLLLWGQLVAGSRCMWDWLKLNYGAIFHPISGSLKNTQTHNKAKQNNPLNGVYSGGFLLPVIPPSPTHKNANSDSATLTLTCPAPTPPLPFSSAAWVLNCLAPSFNSAKPTLRSETDGAPGPAEIRWHGGFLPMEVNISCVSLFSPHLFYNRGDKRQGYWI